MLFLRIYLLAGLVGHKLVWQLMKRTQGRNNHRSEGIKPKLAKAIKIIILVGIVIQTQLPDVLPISTEPYYLRLVGVLIYSAGLTIAIRSRRELGANWSDIESAQIRGEHKIVSAGPYRFIRHPIYVGDLLLLMGLELALNSWLIVGVLLLIPIVLRQAVKEEQKLEQVLPGYRTYCSRTKRFIPFVV